MRSNLESYGNLEKYLDEATKGNFIAEINKVVDWIYGEGENAPKEQYRTKLEEFKKIGDPVKQRHFYYSELDVYFSQIAEAEKNILMRSDTIEHITDEQKETITKKVAAAKEFFAKVQADRAAKQLHENPAFNLDQIISTVSLLKSETEAVFASVKPPKKEEKLAEEEKKPEDAEMKNEEKPAEEGE